MSEIATDPNAVVSHEQDGRVLSGVGVSADRLAATMDRHVPDSETPADAQQPEPAPVPAGATSEPLTAPKLTRGQARFSELTEQRKAAERERDEARRERDEFKARFEQQPAVPQPPQQPDPQYQPPAAPEPTRPKPVETDYASTGDYVEDLARWVVEQREGQIVQRTRDSIDSDRARDTFHSHIERSWVRGRTAYADFDAVRTNGPGANVAMPAAAVQAIYNLPNTEHVQYAIMRDGALAQKLSGIAMRAARGDLGAAYEFGAALANVAPAEPAAPSASTGSPSSVMPPAPIQPVGSGSKTTTPSSAELVKGFDFDASGYRERRAAERGGRR